MRKFAFGIVQRWRRGPVMLAMLTSLAILMMTSLVPTGWGVARAHVPHEVVLQNLIPASYLPYMLNTYCSGTRDAANPMGLQTYGATGYTRADFELLQGTHNAWLRNHIDWYAVEPENVDPSAYRWSVADNSLRAANDNCTNMIVTFDGTPRWAATSHIHSPYLAEMEAEFVEFVAATVERYDGDGHDDAPGSPVVNYWEFYNEPDVGQSALGDGWGVHPEAYAQMLKAVYPVIKEANEHAQVVFGGISHDNFTENGGIFVRDFLVEVLEAGGGPYFDVMNVHYYPFHAHRTTWTESKSSGLLEKINHIHDLLAEYELAKPLMITEVGWHSSGSTRSPSSPEYQSRYVMQLLTQAKATGAMAIIWWTFVDAPDYPFKSGVATFEHTKKPAYSVYVEAVRRIGDAQDVQLLVEPTATSDLEVFQSLIYESSDAETPKVQYIAWLNPIAPFNAEAVATFNDRLVESWQAPGLRARVFGKSGNLRRTAKDADDGTSDGLITINVGTDPIYIVIDEPVEQEQSDEEE